MMSWGSYWVVIGDIVAHLNLGYWSSLTSDLDVALRIFTDICLELHYCRAELSGYLSLSLTTLALRYNHRHCMHAS
jgi:hypothetical protein